MLARHSRRLHNVVTRLRSVSATTTRARSSRRRRKRVEASDRAFQSSAYLDSRATPAMMRSAAWIMAGIVLLITAVVPFRRIVIGLHAGAYVVYGVALVAGYVLSGLLLAWWSRRSHNSGVTVLAATYLFAAVMVLANVIVILEPSRSPGAARMSLWLWVLWHFGVPLGVLAYTQRRLTIGAGLKSAALAAAAASAAAFLFAWFGSGHLILINGLRITSVFSGACTVAGLVVALALWRLLRTRSSKAPRPHACARSAYDRE